MKRRIITIDEDKCNGCGLCIPDCPEGALQIIDGKARLISDLFCDGLGACIKTCPVDALHIEEREAEEYNEAKVMVNIVKGGENVIKAHLKHLKEHGENKLLEEAINYMKENNIEIPVIEEDLPCGCPGSMQRDLRKNIHHSENNVAVNMQSEIANWPIQLKLMNPNAPYLNNADLLISALSEKELCVHELSSLLKMKQPSISQHLKTLWQARVVKKRKVGLHVFYRLDDEHIEKIYTWGYEHVKE